MFLYMCLFILHVILNIYLLFMHNYTQVVGSSVYLVNVPAASWSLDLLLWIGLFYIVLKLAV